MIAWGLATATVVGMLWPSDPPAVAQAPPPPSPTVDSERFASFVQEVLAEPVKPAGPEPPSIALEEETEGERILRSMESRLHALETQPKTINLQVTAPAMPTFRVDAPISVRVGDPAELTIRDAAGITGYSFVAADAGGWIRGLEGSAIFGARRPGVRRYVVNGATVDGRVISQIIEVEAFAESEIAGLAGSTEGGTPLRLLARQWLSEVELPREQIAEGALRIARVFATVRGSIERDRIATKRELLQTTRAELQRNLGDGLATFEPWFLEFEQWLDRKEAERFDPRNPSRDPLSMDEYADDWREVEIALGGN